LTQLVSRDREMADLLLATACLAYLLQRKLCSLSRPTSVNDGVLRYIVSSGLVDEFCNVFVALRILSVPVTVASAERSFSELKIIKSYLRSTMSQQQPSRPGLALKTISARISQRVI